MELNVKIFMLNRVQQHFVESSRTGFTAFGGAQHQDFRPGEGFTAFGGADQQDSHDVQGSTAFGGAEHHGLLPGICGRGGRGGGGDLVFFLFVSLVQFLARWKHLPCGWECTFAHHESELHPDSWWCDLVFDSGGNEAEVRRLCPGTWHPLDPSRVSLPFPQGR